MHFYYLKRKKRNWPAYIKKIENRKKDILLHAFKRKCKNYIINEDKRLCKKIM